MKNILILIGVVVIGGGIALAQLIEVVPEGRVSKPVIETPAKVAVKVADNSGAIARNDVIVAVLQEQFPVFVDSPEIDNIDYNWLAGLESACYPGYKGELSALFKTGGIITEEEYSWLIRKCVDYSEAVTHAEAKNDMQEFLK